ncbi:MAG: aminotransferase class I/II-fold pyridoxal phosphate-dependent enzyme [Candidatus Nanohaloarchaeota archaeon QJJ-9]|nr:aminotransferase class I/II-fold pyridoxal phosphate-dependent enzyme [Candidatus Nanohaloarchaeota archaeon QJJ-9]
MKDLRESVRQGKFSIREISDKARRIEDVVRLDIGQPDYPTPESVKKAAEEALRSKKIKYTSLWGMKELRKEISRYEGHKLDEVTKENVLVTTGGTGALFSVFSTLCEPGENILFNDPCWTVYSLQSKVSSVEINQTEFFKDGELDKENIKESIGEDTKAIVVNNPENPSGRVYSKKELEEIAEVAKEEGLWIIADEVYDRMLYNAKHVSMGEIAPERSIIINSMSKNFAMTGWRIGWVIAGDEEIIHELGKVNRATTACPNTLAQYAALEALKEEDDYIEEMLEEYKGRRDLMQDYIDELGWSYVEPRGAFYLFPEVNQDSWKFSKKLLEEEKVAVVPGEPSGENSSEKIRLCFGSADKEDIKKGMERIQRFL